MSPELRRSKSLVIEVDATPLGLACSGSIKGSLGLTDVTETVDRQRPLYELYSTMPVQRGSCMRAMPRETKNSTTPAPRTIQPQVLRSQTRSGRC
jgi:hypothetical protein